MGKNQKLKQQRKVEREEQGEIDKKRSGLVFKVLILVFIILIGGGLTYWAVTKDKVAEPDSEEATTPAEEEKKSELKEITVDAEKIKNKTATIKTDKGNIVIKLLSDNAPKTITNFIDLAEQGFYNGTTFHRVVEDFVIQGGDPNSKDDDTSDDGQGDPGYKFADEINAQSLGLAEEKLRTLEVQGYQYTSDIESVKHAVGSVSMANSGPNTNGSQFFIVTTQAQPELDGKHTVFGTVTYGMNVVKQITANDTIKEIIIK